MTNQDHTAQDHTADAIQSALERAAAGDPAAERLDPEAADLVRLAMVLEDTLPTHSRPAFRASLQASLQDSFMAEHGADGVDRERSESRAGGRAGAAGGASADSASATGGSGVFGLLRPWTLRLAGAMLALALIMGSAAVASADALPGDALYPVKRSMEDARVLLAFDAGSRAMVHLDIAEIRLSEIQSLIDRGIAVPASLIEDFVAAQVLAAQAADDSGDPDLQRSVAETTRNQSQILVALTEVGDDVEDIGGSRPNDREGAVGDRDSPADSSDEPAADGRDGNTGSEGDTADDGDGSAGIDAPGSATAVRTATATPSPQLPTYTPRPVATEAPASPLPPTQALPTATEAGEQPTPTSQFGDERKIRLTEWARGTQTAESSGPNASTPRPPEAQGPTDEPTAEPTEAATREPAGGSTEPPPTETPTGS